VTGSMRLTPTTAYRLKCIGKLRRAKVGHSEILTTKTAENPLLLAPTDKIGPTIVFGTKFSVGFSSRTDWLDPDSVLSPNSVTFYTDGSLLNVRCGAGCISGIPKY
jgi:hypothetical protein